MAVKAQNAGIPATYSTSPGQFELWNVSMGEVPNGTRVTGEVLCSPGLEDRTGPWLWWIRACTMKSPLFLCHISFLPPVLGLFFFSVLVSTKIEKTFFSYCCPLWKDRWSAWVPLLNLGWLCWKWSLTTFFQHPPFAPPILPQWGWDQVSLCH